LRNPMPDPRCKFGVGCTMALQRARYNVTCWLGLLDIVTILPTRGIFPLVQEVPTATQRHSRDFKQALCFTPEDNLYAVRSTRTHRHPITRQKRSTQAVSSTGSRHTVPTLKHAYKYRIDFPSPNVSCSKIDT
jgi:hypothetical protein